MVGYLCNLTRTVVRAGTAVAEVDAEANLYDKVIAERFQCRADGNVSRPFAET